MDAALCMPAIPKLSREVATHLHRHIFPSGKDEGQVVVEIWVSPVGI